MIVSNTTFRAMNDAGLIHIDMSGIHRLRVNEEVIHICDHLPGSRKPVVLSEEQMDKLGDRLESLDELLYLGFLEFVKFETVKISLKRELSEKLKDEIREDLRNSF